jgi:hypothetical protein
MKEIFDQFKGIANDFRIVKQSQKQLEQLLRLVLILLAVNLLLSTLIFLRTGNTKKKVEASDKPKIEKPEQKGTPKSEK